MEIEHLIASHQALMRAISGADESAICDCQDKSRNHLEVVAKSAGLKGTLKADPKWAGQIVGMKVHERMGSRIKALAGKIANTQTFQGADVKQEIEAMSATPPKQLKDVASALGYAVAGTKSPAILIGLLEKMTGISSIQIDSAVVASHVQKLNFLYERSIDSLPQGEIKAEIKELKALELPELACIAEEFGLDRPGKKKADILKRIESKITATYKAKTANRV